MGKSIKLFSSTSKITLEQETNQFIAELPEGYTTDIQFQYNETDEYTYYAVMITFQKG